MKFAPTVTAAAVALVAAGTCRGQSTTNLYLLKSENISSLCSAESAPGVPNSSNTFWIGHNPCSIAYGKGRLFVGGFVNGSAFPLDGADADGDSNTTETSPFTTSIVKINDILKVRSFSTVPGSRAVAANSRGYTGLDYAPNIGANVRGLVAAVDINSGSNLISRFDVDLAGNGVLVAPVPSLVTSFRLGSCGPAWDFGPTGLGVDYAPVGALDGVPDGPVICAMDFTAPAPRGPYGLNPNTLNAGVNQTLYEFFGNPGVQFNNGPRIVADGEGNTFYRDIDVHPGNGDFAVRSSNTVIYNMRNPDGTTTRVDLAPADSGTTRLGTIADFVPGQNVQFMHGYGDASVGELLVWNSRTTTGSGQAFADVVKLNATRRADPNQTGAPVTPVFLNPDGSAASLPSGIGYYDFAWDQGTQILFVLDFGGRTVYLFSNEQPRACCLSDGSCFLLNPSACAAPEVGGTAGAVGSSCTPSPCAQPTAACCFADGTCQNLDSAACATAGGTAQASGSVCLPNPCPQPANGACCNGTICTETSAAGCTGTFRGSNTVCEFVGNPVTCCPANFNLVGGVTVQDIFDFLSAYFNSQPAADFNASGAVTVQDIFDFLSAYFLGC